MNHNNETRGGKTLLDGHYVGIHTADQAAVTGDCLISLISLGNYLSAPQWDYRALMRSVHLSGKKHALLLYCCAWKTHDHWLQMGEQEKHNVLTGDNYQMHLNASRSSSCVSDPEKPSSHSPVPAARYSTHSPCVLDSTPQTSVPHSGSLRGFPITRWSSVTLPH